MVQMENTFGALMENLTEGCFLVTGGKEPNVMLIGWGCVGIMWRKKVVMVPVRHSRQSHENLDALGEFTVCIPKKGEMKEARGICGTVSGRNEDKIAKCGFTMLPSEHISTPYIADCAAVYECKTLYKLDMTEANLQQDIVKTFYANGDYHTMYYGEIIACH